MVKKCPLLVVVTKTHSEDYGKFEDCIGPECTAYEHGKCRMFEHNGTIVHVKEW